MRLDSLSRMFFSRSAIFFLALKFYLVRASTFWDEERQLSSRLEFFYWYYFILFPSYCSLLLHRLMFSSSCYIRMLFYIIFSFRGELSFASG